MESIALAFFPELTAGMQVMDLGTGSGIIPVILANREQGLSIFAIEVQPFLAALAQENMSINGYGERFTIIQDDLASLQGKRLIASTFDVVLANPPFHPINKHRPSLGQAEKKARFAAEKDLSVWVETAAFLLKKEGRFNLVFPVSRFLEVIRILGQRKFKPFRLSWICSKRNNLPTLFLLESVLNSRYCRLNVLANVFP